ncbi:Nif3-like dinuclear metal center hexameric protein [Streptomyces nigra]
MEEGGHHTTASFARRTPLDRFTSLYRDAGATIAYGTPPLVVPTGRAVGGTTVVNSGTCYRTPDHVLTRWRTTHGFAAADGLAGHLDEAERTLRVARQPLDVLGENGRLALSGARNLGWAAGPLRRNAPGCRGSCQCVVGCPTGAKQSVQLSVLPEACASGARIVTGARVRRLLTDRDRPGGPVAAGVLVSRPDGSELEILSPLVVVAAGALQTPQLLRRSGLGAHPALGRNLSVHPALSVAGRFSAPVGGGRAVLQSVAVEELHADGILIEATAAPPGMSSFVVAGDPEAVVRTVAVSGGSGDSLFDQVRAAGADAFLTADLRHHPVSEAVAHSPLALLDAAHWATEWPWCELAASQLDEISDRHGWNLRVHVSKTVTDPWTAHAASTTTDSTGAPN